MADGTFPEVPPVLALLRLQQVRREQDLPTISVLVGPADEAEAYWRQWGAEARFRVTSRPRDAAGQLVPALVNQIGANCDLPRLALNVLLQRVGRPPTASTSPLAPPLDGRTLVDLDALAGPALAEPDPAGTAAAAHEICRVTLKGGLAAPDLAAQLDARLADRTGRPDWRVLRALDGLLPAGACPAVLLTAPPNPAGNATNQAPAPAPLEAAAHALAEFAQTVPNWPVAMALSPAEFDLYRRTAPDSQTKSLLTTGVIGLPTAPRHYKSRRQTSRGKPQPAPSVNESLRAAAVEAARAHERALAESADAARSAAERLLFQMLEANTTTKGHFAQNGSPGFKFGNRPAEVDLLASDLRLAIEIDGFFHFTHPDRYRSDRRKDWLLQSHGYTVVRVLAEDVSSRMQNVLDFLVSVVEDRRGAATPVYGGRGNPT